jgi:hypothetical protein
MEKIKLNLSMVDRANLAYLIAKSGSIEEVTKYQAWEKELSMSDKEKELEQSFNQIRDKDSKDKSLNEWYNTKNEIELSVEFVNYLAEIISSKNDAKAILITDPIELYQYIVAIQTSSC